MTHSIIGAGNLGTALATQFARNHIPVVIANTRGPDSIASLAGELAPWVTPLARDAALACDVVILAMPFRAHADVGRARQDWEGTIVIDATNTYGVTPEELGGRASTDIVAAAFPGARVVKAFNQLPAKVLTRPAGEHDGRRVVFISSDDDAAAASVAQLAAGLGFAPIQLGRVNEGGRLLERGGPLILQNLVKLG